MSSIDLSKPFISMHIRRGDKSIEAKAISIDKYFKEAEKRTNIRKCFIFTDDYSVVEKVRNDYQNWEIFTICKPEDRGYIHSKFTLSSKEVVKNRLVYLFANIEIMAMSKYFFGTLSSNIGMYMYWRMAEGHCIGIDFKDWRIW